MTTLFEFNYSTHNWDLGSHVMFAVYNMFKIVKFFGSVSSESESNITTDSV
jgi:hypothetical protein